MNEIGYQFIMKKFHSTIIFFFLFSFSLKTTVEKYNYIFSWWRYIRPHFFQLDLWLETLLLEWVVLLKNSANGRINFQKGSNVLLLNTFLIHFQWSMRHLDSFAHDASCKFDSRFSNMFIFFSKVHSIQSRLLVHIIFDF